MSADFCVSAVQGGESYQSAFYVFEELASAPGTSAPLSIVGQAISEIHLGRLPEAEAALTAALEKFPTNVELIANSIVLNVLAGKQTEDMESYVIPSWLRLNEIVDSMLTCISRLAGYNRSSPPIPFSLTSRKERVLRYCGC
jgi:Coatomer epsilon subunit.